MTVRLWEEKIRQYAPQNALEQQNVLQELVQHVVLASLARAGLFKVAAFHGGTCLRMLFDMPRFSEDLDFLLKRPDPGFAWQPYLQQVHREGGLEGIEMEIVDRAEVEGVVRKAFLKSDSIGKLLLLDLPFARDRRRKIRVKLEIDTNPPAGSAFETRFITFPTTAAITTQQLPSAFATKAHALLCRSYVKGRDWYDLLWYVSRRIVPDLALLGRALDQQGPWAGQNTTVTPTWLVDTLGHRIDNVDWRSARADVARFLPAREQPALATWGRDLFRDQLARLASIL
jgi:hypothetical protein